jgi:hypothetical protein
MSGNIFKDTSGNPSTIRINRHDIDPTLRWLEKSLKLPLRTNVLGSAGKKSSSGDIDVAVDQSMISKDELINRLNTLSDTLADVKKSGISVHFRAPILGNRNNGFVQVDFMFGDDIQFMKFGLHSAGDSSKFSGADRNLFMSSIAKSLPGDLKYSWQRGLIRRSDSHLISKDPDKIAQTLLGHTYGKDDLDRVEDMLVAVNKDTSRVKGLRELSHVLRISDGKKPGQARIDREEAERIERILAA